VADSLPRFHQLTGPLLRDAESGADTTVWMAATQPQPRTGQLWHDRRVRPTHLLRRTRTGDRDRNRRYVSYRCRVLFGPPPPPLGALQRFRISLEDFVARGLARRVGHGDCVADDLELIAIHFLIGVFEADRIAHERPLAGRNLVAQH